MANHEGKEGRIEPWEWAVESGDQTPCKSEEEIAAVVDLASQTV